MFGLDSFETLVWGGILCDALIVIVAIVSIVIAYRSLTK